MPAKTQFLNPGTLRKAAIIECDNGAAHTVVVVSDVLYAMGQGIQQAANTEQG